MHNLEILIPITLFAAIFGILYVFLITRNKERMAMIEKGVDASLLTGKRNRFGLKIGLLFSGVALGILTGQLLAIYTSIIEEAAMFSMIFLFAGMGLIAEHFIPKKENENV